MEKVSSLSTVSCLAVINFRLTPFSLGEVKMHSHKVPRSTGKPQRHQKQSLLRRAALFKSNPALGAPLPVMHALPTERSRDRRTAQQVLMVVPWVSCCPLLAQCGLTVEIGCRHRLMSTASHTNTHTEERRGAIFLRLAVEYSWWEGCFCCIPFPH